jgi:hypothetical protein
MIENRVRRVYVRDRRVAEQARAFDALGSKLALIAATAHRDGRQCRQRSGSPTAARVLSIVDARS